MLVGGSRNNLTESWEECNRIEDQAYNDLFPPRSSNPEAILCFHIR